MSKPCKCLHLADEKLRPMGARVDSALSFTDGRVRARVATFWIDGKRHRKPPPILVSTFCPFCGKEYP